MMTMLEAAVCRPAHSGSVFLPNVTWVHGGRRDGKRETATLLHTYHPPTHNTHTHTKHDPLGRKQKDISHERWAASAVSSYCSRFHVHILNSNIYIPLRCDSSGLAYALCRYPIRHTFVSLVVDYANAPAAPTPAASPATGL